MPSNHTDIARQSHITREPYCPTLVPQARAMAVAANTDTTLVVFLAAFDMAIDCIGQRH